MPPNLRSTKKQKYSKESPPSSSPTKSTKTEEVLYPERQQQHESKENWWKIEKGNTGALQLVKRCRKVYGWSKELSIAVLEGYRQFLHISAHENDTFAPSTLIHCMWIQHIQDVANYAQDCILLFGQVIDHQPDRFSDKEATKVDRAATKSALAKHFPKANKSAVWSDLLAM